MEEQDFKLKEGDEFWSGYTEARWRIEEARRNRSTELRLESLKLSMLPDSLWQLEELRDLYLSMNGLATLPSALGNLTKLQTLELSSNQLVTIPESLGKLTALKVLSIANNQLTSVPESLRKLTRLHKLDLSNNQLAKVPELLANLAKLQMLCLSNNQLATLPESLLGSKNLVAIFLHGNPKLRLPLDILGPTYEEVNSKHANPADLRAILTFYFAQRKQDAKPLNEVKLLLVGHGRVGKTSLSKALRGVSHDDLEKETPGIERHPLPLTAEKCKITAHIWDFGGQEFLHQTHQFFFSERSLYLVVLAGRDRAPMQETEYWLRLIRTYGTGSPVVIVLNKIHEHRFTLDEFNLKDRYPEVKAVAEVDCAPRHNITELREFLGNLAGEMPGVREKIAPEWAEVRMDLEKTQASFVAYGEYQSICARHDVDTPEQQEILATILNCLGIALNYRNDSRLRDKSVLKPRWLVDGIYSILRWLQKHKTNGVLKLHDLAGALPDQGTYPSNMHGFLLALMEKFELCFPMDEAAGDPGYLVPGLLTENQPQAMTEFIGKQARRIQYRYDDVRPPGLLPRFIVRSHTLSEGQPRWQKGVVLVRGQARALVRGDYAGRVTDVFAIGEPDDRVWLTEFILSEMNILNGSLPVKTLVESEAQPGAWTELEVLRADNQKGVTTRTEKTSDAHTGTVQVNVKEMLREVETPEASLPVENPLPLFICYSHADERLVRQLKPGLTVLARRGYISAWRDTDLVPGEDWDETIKEKLSEAQMILFMVSRDFLHSEYITTKERPLAIQLMAEEKAVVVPILLLDCLWKGEDFARLENLPRKGVTVSSFDPRAKGWVLVEEGIMRAVEKFRKGRRNV